MKRLLGIIMASALASLGLLAATARRHFEPGKRSYVPLPIIPNSD